MTPYVACSSNGALMFRSRFEALLPLLPAAAAVFPHANQGLRGRRIETYHTFSIQPQEFRCWRSSKRANGFSGFL